LVTKTFTGSAASSSAARRRRSTLLHYVGRAVRIAGEGPIVGDTAWHLRDLTIMRAKVVDRRPK